MYSSRRFNNNGDYEYVRYYWICIVINENNTRSLPVTTRRRLCNSINSCTINFHKLRVPYGEHCNGSVPRLKETVPAVFNRL